MESHVTQAGDGRTTRWAGHRKRRRDEFVLAAVDVIAAAGPNASVEQIAAAAGVTRQVLYRHFDGRSDLDEAIVQHAASLVYARVLADLDERDDITAAARSVLNGYLDFIEEKTSLYWFTHAHRSAQPTAAVDNTIDQLATVALAIAEGLIEERGSAPAVPISPVLAVGLIGLIDASVSRWLVQPGAMTRDQLVDGLVLVLTAGVDALIPPST